MAPLPRRAVDSRPRFDAGRQVSSADATMCRKTDVRRRYKPRGLLLSYFISAGLNGKHCSVGRQFRGRRLPARYGTTTQAPHRRMPRSGPIRILRARRCAVGTETDSVGTETAFRPRETRATQRRSERIVWYTRHGHGPGRPRDCRIAMPSITCFRTREGERSFSTFADEMLRRRIDLHTAHSFTYSRANCLLLENLRKYSLFLHLQTWTRYATIMTSRGRKTRKRGTFFSKCV